MRSYKYSIQKQAGKAGKGTKNRWTNKKQTGI